MEKYYEVLCVAFGNLDFCLSYGEAFIFFRCPKRLAIRSFNIAKRFYPELRLYMVKNDYFIDLTPFTWPMREKMNKALNRVKKNKEKER